MLCGFTPQETGQLRHLGQQPLVVTVCADPENCVSRYAG
jgi:hypothetical protein